MDREKYNKIADHIFKKDEIKQAVYDVLYNGATIYRAELNNNVSKNSLARYVKVFESELEYIKSLEK